MFSLDQAKQKVTDYAQPKYGRGPQNDDEWSKVGQGINYQDGVDDNELGQAYKNTDSLASSMGATNKLAPSPAPTPKGDGSVPPLQQQANSAISGLISQSQQAPSLGDPMLKAQSDAFGVQQQRAAERQRNAMAERYAGTGSGGMDVGLNRIEAQRGLNQGNFDADLLAGEVGRRDKNLLAALGLAQSPLDRELRSLLGFGGLDLNRELGLGDLSLRKDALGTQRELGRGDLGLRLMQTLFQNDQFNSSLGLDAARLQALLNQGAMDALIRASSGG